MKRQYNILLEIAALVVRLLRGGFGVARPQDLRVQHIFLTNKNSFTMRSTATKQFLQAVMVISISLPLLLITTGCGDNKAAVPGINSTAPGTLAVLGLDQSRSVAGYRPQDTGFVAAVCHNVAPTGGVVIAYGIGEPTDQSGLRCYLKLLPKMDNSLVLSKRAELKHHIDMVAAENEKAIQDFLGKVQVQIFNPIRDSTKKIRNTDINGFFKKVDVLLGEPENQSMTRYVFCYSDGVQSLNRKDSPAHYQFKSNSHFTLCLAGWKTKLPCDSVETRRFEDPQGFLQFIKSNNSFNN